MNGPLLRLSRILCCLLAAACSGSPSQASQDATAAIDRIVVLYSPSGDLGADDVQRREIVDPERIARWLSALAAVPELPVRGVRLISFLGNPPEHRVELHAGGTLRGVRRLKAGLLDVAAHEGWAFYSGEDREFAALVAAVLPG